MGTNTCNVPLIVSQNLHCNATSICTMYKYPLYQATVISTIYKIYLRLLLFYVVLAEITITRFEITKNGAVGCYLKF